MPKIKPLQGYQLPLDAVKSSHLLASTQVKFAMTK